MLNIFLGQVQEAITAVTVEPPPAPSALHQLNAHEKAPKLARRKLKGHDGRMGTICKQFHECKRQRDETLCEIARLEPLRAAALEQMKKEAADANEREASPAFVLGLPIEIDCTLLTTQLRYNLVAN